MVDFNHLCPKPYSTHVDKRGFTCPNTWGPFYRHGLTLVTAWISYQIPCKVCYEVTYPFPNSICCIFEVWEWIGNFISHFIMDIIAFPGWGWIWSMSEKGSLGNATLPLNLHNPTKHFSSKFHWSLTISRDQMLFLKKDNRRDIERYFSTSMVNMQHPDSYVTGDFRS